LHAPHNGKFYKEVFKILLSVEIPGQARNEEEAINLLLARSEVIANFAGQ
jgi:hypothetical protein